MADDFTWMLGMHRVASQFGDGLKPELVELLSARHHDADNVQVLPVRQKSSGSPHQHATQTDLTAPNIASFPGQSTGPIRTQDDPNVKSDQNTQPLTV